MGRSNSIVDTRESGHPIGIDTPIFFYHMEQSTPFAPLAGDVLRAVANGDCRGVTSIITVLEVSVRPHRLGRPKIADAYEALIGGIHNLTIADLDSRIARSAADLRARFGLRTPDALQIAACLVHDAKSFIANDRRLRGVTAIDVRVLADFA